MDSRRYDHVMEPCIGVSARRITWLTRMYNTPGSVAKGPKKRAAETRVPYCDSKRSRRGMRGMRLIMAQTMPAWTIGKVLRRYAKQRGQL